MHVLPRCVLQGGRVYDSKYGVTCHWCRQKTLEEHVTCTHPDCGAGRRLAVAFWWVPHLCGAVDVTPACVRPPRRRANCLKWPCCPALRCVGPCCWTEPPMLACLVPCPCVQQAVLEKPPRRGHPASRGQRQVGVPPLPRLLRRGLRQLLQLRAVPQGPGAGTHPPDYQPGSGGWFRECA